MTPVEHELDQFIIASIKMAIEYANILGLDGKKIEEVDCTHLKHENKIHAFLIEYSHFKKGKK